MKLPIKMLALGVILGLATTPGLSYAGHGNGKDKHKNKDYKGDKHHKYHGDDDDGEWAHYRGPYFTRDRVVIIRNYYTPEQIEGLPPGLRKHIERTGHLPPGLEKKLAINQTLPPEYDPYLVPAPPQLISTLPPLPPDSSLYLYNGDAILMDRRTGAVLDIVRGVVTLGGH
jgi:hypothetical protein